MARVGVGVVRGQWVWPEWVWVWLASCTHVGASCGFLHGMALVHKQCALFAFEQKWLVGYPCSFGLEPNTSL